MSAGALNENAHAQRTSIVFLMRMRQCGANERVIVARRRHGRFELDELCTNAVASRTTRNHALDERACAMDDTRRRVIRKRELIKYCGFYVLIAMDIKQNRYHHTKYLGQRAALVVQQQVDVLKGLPIVDARAREPREKHVEIAMDLGRAAGRMPRTREGRHGCERASVKGALRCVSAASPVHASAASVHRRSQPFRIDCIL